MNGTERLPQNDFLLGAHDFVDCYTAPDKPLERGCQPESLVTDDGGYKQPFSLKWTLSVRLVRGGSQCYTFFAPPTEVHID